MIDLPLARLIRHPSEHAWSHAIGQAIAAQITADLGQHGHTTVWLSGGTTPAPAYRALAAHPIDWAKVTIGLVDERWLSAHDPHTNGHLLQQHLLPQTPGARFYPLIHSNHSLADCVTMANRQAQQITHVSVAVLGMGSDGHTASLFPGSKDLNAALQSHEDYVALDATGCPVAQQWPRRISLTPKALARVATRLLLIRGQDKLQVLDTAFAARDPLRYPIYAIANRPGPPLAVHWCP